MIIKDELRPIPSFDGRYLISRCGDIYSTVSERYLRQRIRNGYPSVGLSRNGKQTDYSVHRLMAKTYLPNYSDELVVNHKNGIKDDNMLFNLEMCTVSENMKHAYKNRLQIAKHGEECHFSKLSKTDVIKIYKLALAREYTQRDIAKLFKISQGYVSSILNKKKQAKAILELGDS